MEDDPIRQYNSTGNGTVANATCSKQAWEGTDLKSVEFILPMVILILFNLVVLAGNILVITAVFTHKKLRTATNTFIVSLAVADLMLGFTVLPFSSANEVLRYWPFGDVWCSVWLAVDVWLCTASILNLCAISFDRYLAITRPFKYPRLMSDIRARVLVASVWVVSFVVCFPPLIGWNERGMGLGGDTSDPATTNHMDFINVTQIITLDDTGSNRLITMGATNNGNVVETYTFDNSHSKIMPCRNGSPVCALTSEPGYIIYSACGSFWIPVWIMAFFYWRIYRTAVKTTSALRRGVLTTKGSGGGIQSSPNSDNQVTLRVHRGGGGNASFKAPKSPNEESVYGLRQSCIRKPSVGSSSRHGDHRGDTQLAVGAARQVATQRESPNTTRNGILGRKKRPKIRITFAKTDTSEYEMKSAERQPLRPQRNGSPEPHPPPLPQKVSIVQNGTKSRVENMVYSDSRTSMDESSTDSKNAGFLNKVGRMHLKTHIKRINKEKKAAKTVGIIVGGFIFCWAPFFTVYLLGAFCPDCTPQILFTVFFWLGYCNSAVNPCVYALCSRDFRYAFKKLIRCRVERTRKIERTGTRFMSLLNSIRIQISSRGSDSNSE